MAASLRKVWSQAPESPFDFQQACRLVGAQLVTASFDHPGGGAQGLLRPLRTGFRISIDPEPRCGWGRVPASRQADLHRHRSRFLVAHELAHTLFYERCPEGARRTVPASPEQERFCDLLARELLVPTAAAQRVNFAPQSVVAVAQQYDVSIELAFRALHAVSPTGSGWLFVDGPGRLHNQWTSESPGRTSSLMPTLDFLAHQARETGEPSRSLTGEVGEIVAMHLPGRDQVLMTAVAA